MEKTKKTGTLVECSVLIAMAFVLSFIKIIDMPYGGAVTAASMLPIIIAGYRNGLKWGLITSFTYSILQLLTGLSNVSYATSTTAMIAIILLDYIVAFTVLGLLGVVKKNKHQTGALVLGTLIVCLLRYLCHFITGCSLLTTCVLSFSTSFRSASSSSLDNLFSSSSKSFGLSTFHISFIQQFLS